MKVQIRNKKVYRYPNSEPDPAKGLIFEIDDELANSGQPLQPKRDPETRHYIGVEVAPAPTLVVPASITRRQLKQQLRAQGDLVTIEAVIATQSEEVQIDWADASTFDRAWPTLTAMVAYLATLDAKWTDAYVDQTFIDAKANFS